MKILTGLFISILFLTLTPSFASAASCQCSTYSTGVAKACEQKSESECYAQLNVKTSCSFFTDDACKTISAPLAPGLAWSKPECDSAKGDWIPKTGETRGPYCFEKQDFSTPYNLSVDILGTNKISNLGQYVNLLYKLVMGLAIFFAIIMTTIAGFKWLTAGGNTGKIGEAKKMIGNALIGLILAAGAYTILQTINPQLVQLHLPRIVKIKTTNYLGVTTCNKYLTPTDCEQNPIGLNSGIAVYAPAGYSGTGCAWDASSNSCVQKDPAVKGKFGGLCLTDNACTGQLKCIFVAGVHVCTDGNVNSVCGSTSDCNAGLICGEGSSCYDPNGKRPQEVSCDTNEQCASGVCENKHCTVGQCDPASCPTSEVCLFVGTSQFKQCGNPPDCILGGNAVCVAQYGAGYYCPSALYSQTDDIKFKTQYLSTNYGAQNSPTARACHSMAATGAQCIFDDECANGSCNGVDVTQNKLGSCN